MNCAYTVVRSDVMHAGERAVICRQADSGVLPEQREA